MSEQRFFVSQQSAAAQPPPPPNTIRTGIQVNWNESAARTIKIRRQHIEMATKARVIHLTQCCLLLRGAQLALEAEAQRDFRFKARKASDLKIQPVRRIRSSALVVLSSCLLPFLPPTWPCAKSSPRHGQRPA